MKIHIPKIAVGLFFLISACLSNASGQNHIRGTAPLIIKNDTAMYKRILTLFQHMSSLYTEGEISFELVPANRSIRNVASGHTDFHFPVMCSQDSRNQTNTKSSSDAFGQLPFAIYSRPSHPVYAADLESAKYKIRDDSEQQLDAIFQKHELTKIKSVRAEFANQSLFLAAIRAALGRDILDEEKDALLHAGFPYVIETAAVHVPYIDIPSRPDISIENSLKKLFRGRIDAYIFPPIPLEKTLKRVYPEQHIARDLHQVLGMCFLVQDSEKGEKVNKTISRLFKQIKSDGTFLKLFGPQIEEEQNWINTYKK
jgi:hypothetical protein